MADWQSKSLGNIAGFSTAMSGFKLAVTTLQGGLAAQKTVLQITTALVPNIYDAANLAVTDAADVITSLITNFLGTGGYMLPVFPQNIDSSRPVIQDQLRPQERIVDQLTRGLDAGRTIDERAANNAAYLTEHTKLLELRKKDKFASTGLATSFGYTDFINTVSDSLNDLGDSARPQFSNQAITCGVVVIVASDTVSDFATAASSFASWLQNPRLKRVADLAAQMTEHVRLSRVNRQSMHQSPDWKRLSLAQFLGLDTVITKLKLASASMGLSSLISGGSATHALNYISDVLLALQSAQAGAQAAVDALAALAALNASVRVLLVPPVDGEITSAVGTLPNITAGNDGFLDKLRTAKNPPTERYMMGVVFMGGTTAGLNLTTLTAQTYQSSAVQTAITGAQTMYSTVKGPFA